MNDTLNPNDTDTKLTVLRGAAPPHIQPRATSNTGVTARDVRLMSKKVDAFIDATFSQYLFPCGRV